MRIAIISDLHLGYGRFYEESFTQAQSAFLKAIENRAELVIIPGDIFDTRIPKPEVFSRAFSLFKMLKNKNIPVIAIHGNHERRSIREQVNPVQLLESAEFVKFLHASGEVFEADGEKVFVFGLGAVPEDLAMQAIIQTKPKPQDVFSIFVFHQTLQEFAPLDKCLSIDELPEGFDLYVNGHLHKKRIEECAGKKLLISGSTVLTQLRKEETEDKGIFLIETDGKEFKAEFLPIETMPFIFKELVFKKASLFQIEERIKEEMEKINEEKQRKSIVKFMLRGTLAEGLKASDISLPSFENHIVEFGLEFDEDEELKKKIESLRKLREERISAKEKGLSVLGEILKGKIENCDEYFNLLEDSAEALYSRIMGEIENEK